MSSAASTEPTTATAWAAASPTSELAKVQIERRAPNDNDVVITIAHCGICHTDLHQARNDWGAAIYPVVPGHEIVGHVAAVGSAVTRHKVGDTVGVGCLVGSCRECEPCKHGDEQYCDVAPIFTYNSPDPVEDGKITFGGYSSQIVVAEDFVVSVPESLDLAAAAPLLCAGVTTFSPLKRYNVGAGTRVGVVGFGGLGAMAVKLAAAMGAAVTVISRSADKTDAAVAAGSSSLLVSKDSEAMLEAAGSFDLILSTIPTGHEVAPYLELLAQDGTIVLLGALDMMEGQFAGGQLVRKRRSISGSLIGGIAETQELLDFCGEHGIVSDIEAISASEINAAYDRLAAGDPGHRFVIDISTIDG